MHADIEQLLNLRGGEPVAEDVRRHVAACRQCSEELERLERLGRRLRGLPAVEPRQKLWEGVAARVMDPPRPRFAWGQWAAVAASCLIAVGLVMRGPGEESVQRAEGDGSPFAEIVPSAPASIPGVDYVAQSRQLEATLRALPAAPRVTRASTAGTIADLEDRIAMIDLKLSHPGLSGEGRRALWEQRVRLMRTLVRVRYAQARDTL
jgi:hypothetical protein